MLLFDVGPVELQGIATVIIFALIFYLLSELRTLRAEMRAIKPTERGNTMLPLQAYERLSLLVDRLSLKNLVARLHSTALSAAELHVLLLDSINSEYEHNITQQIYVNPQVWKAVTNMKEQNIYIINQLAQPLPKYAAALDLSKAILEYAGQENAELNGIVLDAIQYEVKKLV
ncbi:MAG: hypothetical protein ABIN67_10815 [Ferruginibacter sp.]